MSTTSATMVKKPSPSQVRANNWFNKTIAPKKAKEYMKKAFKKLIKLENCLNEISQAIKYFIRYLK